MFWSNELLGRKSPFAVIWIVAHGGKKLGRAKILAVDVAEACKRIMHPDVPLSLRLSGILAGGVVKVFSRQIAYLHDDSLEAARSLADFEVQTEPPEVVVAKKDKTLRKITLAYEEVAAPGTDSNAPPSSLQRKTMLAEEFLVMSTLPDLTADPAAHDDLVEVHVPELSEGFGPAMGLGLAAPGAPGSGTSSEPLAGQPLEFEGAFDMPAIDDIVIGGQAQPWSDGQRSPLGLAAGGGSADWGVQMGSGGGWSGDGLPAAVTPEASPVGAASPADESPAKRKKGKGLKKLRVDEETTVRGRDYRLWTTDQSEIVKDRLHEAILGKRRATTDAGDLDGPEIRHLLESLYGPLDAAFLDRLSALFPRLPLLGGIRKRAKKDASPLVPAPATPNAPVPEPQPWAGAGSPMPGDFGPGDLFQAHYNDMYAPGFDYELGGGGGTSGGGASGATGSGARVPRSSDDPGPWAPGSALRPSPSLRASLGSEAALEVERLRAALGTPAAGGTQAQLARLGLVSSGSGHVSGSTRVPSSRPTSNTGPGNNTVYSDIDADLNEFLPLEGYQGPDVVGPGSSGCGTGSGVSKALGSLTQFELPEETARETQPSVTVAGALSRTTLAMLRLFRAKFLEQSAKGQQTPDISTATLSRGLSRGEAAKLFYQVCVCASAGFIKVQQDVAYGDIVLRQGRGL